MVDGSNLKIPCDNKECYVQHAPIQDLRTNVQNVWSKQHENVDPSVSKGCHMKGGVALVIKLTMISGEHSPCYDLKHLKSYIHGVCQKLMGNTKQKRRDSVRSIGGDLLVSFYPLSQQKNSEALISCVEKHGRKVLDSLSIFGSLKDMFFASIYVLSGEFFLKESKFPDGENIRQKIHALRNTTVENDIYIQKWGSRAIDENDKVDAAGVEKFACTTARGPKFQGLQQEAITTEFKSAIKSISENSDVPVALSRHGYSTKWDQIPVASNLLDTYRYFYTRSECNTEELSRICALSKLHLLKETQFNNQILTLSDSLERWNEYSKRVENEEEKDRLQDYERRRSHKYNADIRKYDYNSLTQDQSNLCKRMAQKLQSEMSITLI